MIQWIIDQIAVYFREGFDIASIFVGVLAVILSKAIGKMIAKIKLAWKNRSNFSVAGVWGCLFDSYIHENRQIVELYYIRQYGDQLSIYIQHYSKGQDGVYKAAKLHGSGAVRGHRVSMCYTTDKKDSETCGVAFFKLKETSANEYQMCGNVYEAYSTLTETKKVELMERMAKEDIIALRRLNFKPKTLFVKWALMLGFFVFRNYDTANQDIARR